MRLIGRLQNSMPMELKIQVERNHQAKELVLYAEDCQYPLLRKSKGNYILLALFFGASAILFCFCKYHYEVIELAKLEKGKKGGGG